MERLVELIRCRLAPKPPSPTEIEPRLSPIPNLRMIAFDVYGTLLTSSAGEIGIESTSDSAFEDAAQRLGLARDAGETVSACFYETIASMHSRDRSVDHPFPEVDIRKVWQAVAERLLDRDRFFDLARIPEIWERFSIEHELTVNPVWIMPGAPDVVASIAASNVRLALVSNAQFYTPLTIASLFGATPEMLGFGPCIYSFEERYAKPDSFLFERLIDEAKDLKAESILYVGNDMRNDVAAAAAVGMRTALFAGDARSLRLREDDSTVGEMQPDLVLTDLRQIEATILEPQGSTP